MFRANRFHQSIHLNNGNPTVIPLPRRHIAMSPLILNRMDADLQPHISSHILASQFPIVPFVPDTRYVTPKGDSGGYSFR